MNLRHATPRYLAAARLSAGFTLLEVLVAILVLSFGVLGAAGMQIAALQSNKEARYQATAARLGAQLADLMRANDGIARQTTNANVFLLDSRSSLPNFSDDCLNKPCAVSAQAAAQYGVQEWWRQFSDSSGNGLPSARVVVCFDDTPFDASNKPQWKCTGPKQTTTRPFIKIGWKSTTISSTSGYAASAISPLDADDVPPKIVLDAMPG